MHYYEIGVPAQAVGGARGLRACRAGRWPGRPVNARAYNPGAS